MSPVPPMARIAARAIALPVQMAASYAEARPPRLLTARDDISPPPFTSPPPNKMTGSTKVGLAMIPIVVALVGLYVIFLFWYRKRRTAQELQSSMAPPVPKKDGASENESIASRRRCSKVFRMAAFVAPLQQSLQCATSPPRNGSAGHKKSGSIDKSIISYPMHAPNPSMVESGMDSPIDGSSPFRLKRGDTVMRCSIGPELSRLWPSPPAATWMKSSTDTSRYAPAIRRESVVYQQVVSRFSR